MERIEKTVFVSYRRTNFPWALAVWQSLNQHGYDVFMDYVSIPAGDFESAILENIHARAHFLIILTPSALELCGEPGDWLRREIETAIECRRNIIPLMLEGFSFGTPKIADQLTGTLAPVKKYQGLTIPNDFFHEAMDRLRTRFLNVPLSAVTQPPSTAAKEAATEQSAAAQAAPQVPEQELTAQQYVEQGVASSDPNEEVRFNSEAIRLKPDYAAAYNNRGVARKNKGDLDGALNDYSQAIRLKPDYAIGYNNRGVARMENGDLDGALVDYNQAIHLKPDDADMHYNRGMLFRLKDQPAAAVADLQQYLDLKGVPQNGDAEVENIIRALKRKI